MAVTKSGASTDLLTIDPTSKAARVTVYDTLGNNRGVKRTYRASTATGFTVASSTAPFFMIQGSSTATIRIQRITISGVLIAAVAYAIIEVAKYSTAVSAGTPVALTPVPMDSNSAASTSSLINVYTAAPTAGTLVGVMESRRILVQSTTPAAGGVPDQYTFDFRNTGEAESLVLRGTAQGVGLNFDAAALNQIGAIMIEYTEE